MKNILTLLFIVSQFGGLNSLLYSQSSDARINEYNSTYTISNKKLNEKIHYSITIFNREGEDLTLFNIPYSKNIICSLQLQKQLHIHHNVRE